MRSSSASARARQSRDVADALCVPTVQQLVWFFAASQKQFDDHDNNSIITGTEILKNCEKSRQIDMFIDTNTPLVNESLQVREFQCQKQVIQYMLLYHGSL